MTDIDLKSINREDNIKKIAILRTRLEDDLIPFCKSIVNELSCVDKLIYLGVFGQLIMDVLTTVPLRRAFSLCDISQDASTMAIKELSQEDIEDSMRDIEYLLKTMIISYVNSTIKSNLKMKKVDNILNDIRLAAKFFCTEETIH